MEQHDEHPLSDNEDPSHDATESDTVTAGNVIRPPSQFTFEKAPEHGPDHLKKSMDMEKTDTYFQISHYSKVDLSIVSALLLLPFTILQPFCTFTCKHLIGVLGTSTLVTAANRMQMWRK